MQRYLRTKLRSVAIVILLIAATVSASPQGKEAQQKSVPFLGRYISLRWLNGEAHVLILDPQLRYIGRGIFRGIQVWSLSTDLTQDNLSYEFPRIRGREVIGGAATKAGLVFISDYPWPDGAEPAGYKLFLWEPDHKELKRLKWGDEFGKNIFTNPDGTELARFQTRQQQWTSNYVTCVEVFDLNGKEIRSITLNKRAEDFFSPTIMDNRGDVYVVAQNHEQTMRFLAVFRSDSQSYEVFKESELLLDKFQVVGEPERPRPILLSDGITLATYVRNTSGQYLIQYFREGKLVKTVGDPVANGTGEARLAITSDGKGVVTQIVSGKKTGLVKVWDIATKKDSEITTTQPIKHIFPWVQGKYAPIWTSADGGPYEAGILEISHTGNNP